MNICLYFGVAPTVEDEGRLKNILLQKSQIQTTILLKESVEFPEPSFRMNFAESPLEVTSDSHFSLEVALELYFPIQNAGLLLLQNSDRKRESCLLGVFPIENPERYL